jgi:hypothetical protein
MGRKANWQNFYDLPMRFKRIQVPHQRCPVRPDRHFVGIQHRRNQPTGGKPFYWKVLKQPKSASWLSSLFPS